jgi:predicted regulator of Ras-like GTPase activity (Roadblock/LC7/MglB family)
MQIAPSRGEELSKLLRGLLQEGGFSLALLGDLDGFPVASAAAAGEEAEAGAAAVALVQRSASQARAQLGLSPTDEIILHDNRGRRLVCRPLRAGQNDLILVVLMKEKGRPYRSITNRALREIRRMFDADTE